MKKNRKIIILCAVVLMFSLSGCSEQIGEDGDPALASAQDTAGISPAPSPSHADASQQSPPHAGAPQQSPPSRVETDLGNNITVDAGVSVPYSESMDVWSARPLSYDTRTLANLLLGEGYWVDTSLPSADTVSYYANETHRLAHSTYGGTEGVSLFPLSMEMSIMGITEHIGESPENLPFMTQQDAVRMLQELLQELGLYTEPTTVYAMDTATIEAAVQTAYATYGWDASALTSHPECYVIQMAQTVNGAMVYSAGKEQIELRAGTMMNPGISGLKPYIWAVITANGIEELSVNSCFELAERVREAPDLISAEQAIEVIRSHYENIINTQRLTINDLALMYTLLPQSASNTSEWELAPTWVCRTVQDAASYNTGRGSGSPNLAPKESAIFIDAVSGQFLKERFQ